MTLLERHDRIRQVADRVRALRLQNLFAFIRRTSHLTGLPADGTADLLSHNWYRCASDERKARMSPEERSAFRYVRRQFDRQWEASRIVDRFYDRTFRQLAPREISDLYTRA
jgi:hypothetical protein